MSPPADPSNGTGETVRFNSTSSLYIDSTISHPDMAQARASPSYPSPASPPRTSATRPGGCLVVIPSRD